MYVDTAPYTKNGKTYKRHLLRKSFREDGKVKKKTIASLCCLKPEEINCIKLALQSKGDLSVLKNISNATVSQGKSYGAVLLLSKIAQELGITEILGNSADGKIALWQIIGRVLFQGSRLSLIRNLEIHAAEELLNLPKKITPKKLHSNLCWVKRNQSRIEKELHARNKGQLGQSLYLYDVTSSYLEGECNELGMYGYNRDKKRGKKQIVIGLLTNSKGYPVAVRVFKGNTSDPKIVLEQINILKDEFFVKRVVLVGDRAMLTKPQTESLPNDYSYITAIGKRQVEKLIKDDVLQLSLFDNTIEEIESEGIRYIVRRSPIRKQEIEESRSSKIASLRIKIDGANKYLLEHPKAKTDTSLKDLDTYLNKLKINKFAQITSDERTIKLIINEQELKEESKLDGCYCITTDLTKEEASKETVHARYKDLALVERAFRAMKQSHLEIRPLFLRREDRTKAYVFITMLGYMMQKKLNEYWKEADIPVSEGLSALTTVTTGMVSVANIKINTTIKPTGICKKLMELAEVAIPKQIGSVYT